ncbi:glycoside hydrolase family 65 protein [Paenibacillus aquistagni]|uniref:Hypothetical glycosyl hydrolase n=1 Tax=Paenibacillus aquistagni TaxID=1852522 RepID=A0A1X7LVR7_9BACL|nr:glycosyl hydrolase family 65 protein [Paenibacillus aquistagni]SMG57557.1 hypothetical glycosyl hydrolase [Paenibacillus aquistagni]
MIAYTGLNEQSHGWVVAESAFDARYLAKYETIFCQGNGYMGLRAAHEESYPGERRNLFVAGTYNRFGVQEVTELPNAADMIQLDIRLNGRPFHLEKGKLLQYRRELDLRKGELKREMLWEDEQGEWFKLSFRRFVSLYDRHLIGQRVEITPLKHDADISIRSSINGQLTNSGAQHFIEGDRRVFDKELIQYTATTTETGIVFVHTLAHQLLENGVRIEAAPAPSMERRKVSLTYKRKVAAGKTLTLDKLASMHTSLDLEWESLDALHLQQAARHHLRKAEELGYCGQFRKHEEAWQAFWNESSIEMDSQDAFDQLAIRFAQYHLVLMTPAHDSRFSVGAKGLTGEGYKGHVFWDTEVFILPYFLYTHPEIARNLVTYRYHTLNGARSKARDNGYEGAMYPWESALTGEEETPEWGPVDIVTGTPTYIWTGKIEQHITADVAYGVWHYYQATSDQAYMDQYGYEILFETATFWASRLEWNDEKGQYHITDVIGPDEYKEHVANNAFTNYMAYWNITKAMACMKQLREADSQVYQRLNEKLGLAERLKVWEEKSALIYLPKPDETTKIIPQDDTYLMKQVIDLSKYRNQEQVASILNDYSMTQLSDIQVSKQADILVLFYLLEDWFTKETKAANWHYYEPKTLHDSSLSLSTHSMLASDVAESELAYEMFQKACQIDLGTNMHSSDEGIHTASIGGIWKAAVMGFGGVRSWEGALRLNPRLPEAWERLSYPLAWQGERLRVTITKQEMKIERLNPDSVQKPIRMTIHGKAYELVDQMLSISLEGGDLA